MLIDLQFHSLNSDGYLTPTDMAKHCNSRGIKVASLTDHNTVSGQEEFKRACKQYNIKAISGMELYVKLGSHHFNMLWYNFDIEHPDLHKILRESQLRRRICVRHALEKLQAKNYLLDINEIIDKQNHYIPINKIIDSFYSSNKARISQELGKKNILETEIIREYFRNTKHTRLHESYVDISRIVKLKRIIGGQLILAHPCKFRWVTEEVVQKLLAYGLDGLEVLTPHHNWEAISYLQAMADRYKLIMTGGSDFHLFEEKEWYKIKSSWNYFYIESSLLAGIDRIIG